MGFEKSDNKNIEVNILSKPNEVGFINIEKIQFYKSEINRLKDLIISGKLLYDENSREWTHTILSLMAHYYGLHRQGITDSSIGMTKNELDYFIELYDKSVIKEVKNKLDLGKRDSWDLSRLEIAHEELKKMGKSDKNVDKFIKTAKYKLILGKDFDNITLLKGELKELMKRSKLADIFSDAKIEKNEFSKIDKTSLSKVDDLMEHLYEINKDVLYEVFKETTGLDKKDSIKIGNQKMTLEEIIEKRFKHSFPKDDRFSKAR